jgi:hypothetical protein
MGYGSGATVAGGQDGRGSTRVVRAGEPILFILSILSTVSKRPEERQYVLEIVALTLEQAVT